MNKSGHPSHGAASGINTSSQKIERSKITPLPLKLKSIYARYGIPWEDINIFGIRDESNMKQDVWNDIIGAIIDEDDNRPQMFLAAPATTDPGVYWTDNKNRAKAGWEAGCAHLCLGFHKNAYVVGLHHGDEALCQYGAAVTIWRDLNGDFKQEV